MPWWLTALNTLAALTSCGFGMAAVAQPALIAPSADGNAPSRFYPAMYATRAVPLGLAVGVTVWWAPTSAFLLPLLTVATLAQAGDIIIGTAHRLPGMVAGAVFATLCHGAAVAASLHALL